MATLSTTAQASLQDAIDLLVKGTARETPLSQDVIQRIAPVVVELDLATTGGAFEIFRDNPYSALIALVLAAGDASLSAAAKSDIADAVLLMITGTAYETPLAEDVITRLAVAAENSGFLTKGGFREAVKDAPISTLLKWALRAGS
jgi:hypothetical protein